MGHNSFVIAVATGQLHLPLALAAHKLSPLQRAFSLCPGAGQALRELRNHAALKWNFFSSPSVVCLFVFLGCFSSCLVSVDTFQFSENIDVTFSRFFPTPLLLSVCQCVQELAMLQ
jgi:hypothetical protein